MRLRSYDRLRAGLAAAGLLIAAYLTLLHYDTSVPLVCGSGRGSVVNCERVLDSPSSVVLGVPVAAWGLLWFVVALGVAVVALRAGESGASPSLRVAAFVWALVGTLSVLWLVYQEVGVVGKICAWCTAVHVLVLAMLVVEVRSYPLRAAVRPSP